MATNKQSAKADNLTLEVESVECARMDAYVLEQVDVSKLKPQATQTNRSLENVDDDMFVATRDMAQARIRLHASVSLQALGNLRVEDIGGIVKYIWPVNEIKLTAWSNIEGFWPWFVGADEVEAEMYMLRKRALTTVKTIMDLDETDMDGVTPNLKHLNLKLQTSRFIMGETNAKQQQAITVNNNILNGVPQRKPSVRKEPLEQLRQKVNRLKTINNVSNSIEAEVVADDER
jgi:hypothetical protein